MQSNRVALLTNFVPPYRVPVFLHLKALFPQLKIFVSTEMEPDRDWKPQWGSLDVAVQKSFFVEKRVEHPHGFREITYTHLPLDTFGQLRRFAPDTVISAEFGPRTFLVCLYSWVSRVVFGKPIRLLVWATLSEITEKGRPWLRKLLRHFILRAVDGALVNGESGARYLKSYGLADDKIFRVPQAVETQSFLALPIDRSAEESRKFIYIGQLIERKGLGRFLRHVSEWADLHPKSKIELVIVGAGLNRDRLKEIGVSDRIQLDFRGSIPYDQVPSIFGECGLMIFPTLADEWGLVVSESMAAGTPVLGSCYSQAVEELIQDGINGWVYSPDDAKSLHKKLDQIFSTSDAELKAIRQRARESVKDYDSKAMAKRIALAISPASASSISAAISPQGN